jgi:hypothetical protein
LCLCVAPGKQHWGEKEGGKRERGEEREGEREGERGGEGGRDARISNQLQPNKKVITPPFPL